MTKKYTESSIVVLSDQEHVRKRVNVYLGNPNETTYDIPLFIDGKFTVKEMSFIPAVYKVIGELFDNACDEYTQHMPKNPIIQIEANTLMGMYTISDHGRGIPIGIHDSGKHTPEVVFGQLRSGRNFDDNKEAGVIGQNGMGVSLTCFCSVDFSVKINRDKKLYIQNFSNGASSISKPIIQRTRGAETGTSVTFQLDSDVFNDVSLPDELMHNRAIEIALSNPGIITEYNGKKYKYPKGFDEIIKKISNNYYKFVDGNLEFFVIFDVHDGIDEQFFTWVNGSMLFDGGVCNTQFINALSSKAISHLQKEAKKQKCEITKNDIKKNVLIIGNIKVSDPQYDAQSKTRLTGPSFRKEIDKLIDDSWSSFVRKNKEWLADVLSRAVDRHHTSANKTAINKHKKALNRKVPGLVDATNKIRYDCKLLITEGLSASSSITESRDPRVTATFPLTGKINNVYGTTTAQLLAMGKITNLLSAIGLVPGQKAHRDNLRFGKIVIATDADPDGADIFTLLINLFYTFWPELFDQQYEPIVYRLLAPNVCLVKGKKRIHFSSRDEYNKKKNKYTGYEVNYYKGLGSMSRQDWDMILSDDTDTLIPIVDDGEIKETLELLFGPNADGRKDWLQEN